MVQSICDCSTVQSSVCLSECLATAPVFLLGATRHFVLFSCNGKALDNIDLNQMSHRHVSGDLQNDWNDPVDFRSLDRSQRRWYIWVSLSYKTVNTVVSSLHHWKNVKSVIDSAVLHWTTRLMVFPRNAGFGRCYLVSTRHEILSNIDRNLTGTQLRLRKNRNKINPARVRIPFQFYCCYFESQTVVFQLLEFHLKKFKEFIIKKFYFHKQTCQQSTWQWLVVGDSPRGQLGPGIGQARIWHRFPCFTEIGRIFHNKYIFSEVPLPQSDANIGSVKDNGGSRIKRYTVVISILSRIRSIFRIYKPRSLF